MTANARLQRENESMGLLTNDPSIRVADVTHCLLTENLQKVLSVVNALSPVAVVIDEADAALGTRAACGDSGTGSRLFAMFASLMGDTRHGGPEKADALQHRVQEILVLLEAAAR
jgi:hypothetical protein